MKRLIDLGLAFAALSILSPVLIILFVLVRWKIGKPALFKQVRPGLRGRPFTMIKFRTMTDERGPTGALLPDARRLTRFGRWLRATSLDELPELINVVAGDMSLVGPRPLLMSYLPLYTPIQARRHEVRPGITGWAQVSGRNSIGWEEKFRLDIEYVDRRSLGMDVRILWLTIARVLGRKDITADGDATMPLFAGTSDLVRKRDGRSDTVTSPD